MGKSVLSKAQFLLLSLRGSIGDQDSCKPRAALNIAKEMGLASRSSP